MKGNTGSRGLSGLMLILGVAALVLRKLLYTVAVDAKGLLVRNHPLTILLAVLTVVALLLVILAVRKEKRSGAGEEQTSASLASAFGNVAAAAGILVTALYSAPVMTGYLEIAWRILGLAAPVCLGLAALARALGKKPFFLLPLTACLFFLLYIVNRYQLWSGNPQMQDYVFALLGAMTLMFFGFYAAAQEAGCGKPAMQLGMGLAALYLCLAELARSSSPVLYLGGLLWVLTELGCMRKVETN